MTGASEDAGISLYDADYCNISDNNVSNNYIGISQGFHIIGCSSRGNTLARNICSNNTEGISLYGDSSDNHLYLNSFRDDTGANVYSEYSANVWNYLGYYTYRGVSYTNYLGNYYNDYTGLDDGSGGRVAGDVIGDTSIPYPTDGDGDNYPLMEKFENYSQEEAPTITSDLVGKIAFVSDRDGNQEIYVMNADGTNVIPLTRKMVDD